MIKNYIKVAIRSLLKQRAYSAINILGLAVGIASSLLIVLFVVDEFSYDKFNVNADRVYKMRLERKYPGHMTNYAIMPHSFAKVIPKDFPEVESTCKVGGPFRDLQVTHRTSDGEMIQFEEDNAIAVDSNFFDYFTIKVLQGTPGNLLKKNTDIVINERTARKYFKDTNAIGKVFRIFGQDFSVTGVVENYPENSHMEFDFLVLYDEQNFGGRRENYTTFSAHIYVMLKPGADPKALEAKFPGMVDRYAAGEIERDLGKSWADYKKEGNGYGYFLQPMTSIHLDPINLEYKIKPVGGNIEQVYFLIAIAALIVIIACINFMNLATARSAERAREVGVRKTMGSVKGQLIAQFLTESVILSLASTFIAVVIVQLTLPSFNSLAHKTLSIGVQPMVIVGLLAVGLVVGLLAGSYPAFVLSAFNPVAVMKGTFSGNGSGKWLRNGLVVFQFWISIVLIVGTIVVYDQMAYMRNKSLGYDKDQLLVVERAFFLRDKLQSFEDELKTIPGVLSTGASSAMFGDEKDMFGAQFKPEASSEILTTKNLNIDDDFAEMIGFNFVKGHGFSRETNDSLSIILNETSVKVMGIEGDPIGQKLSQVQRNQDGNVTVFYTIIGVVSDFNFQSLRDKITPLTITSTDGGGFRQYVYARLNSNDYKRIISSIEEKWKSIISLTRRPGEPTELPLKYTFLDQNLEAAYEAEQRAGTLFSVFAGLAIAIACVGLFGLAAYTASLRTKEIGIRKVMGASVSSVIFLLTKDFTKLIMIAFALAVPLSWYIMDNWLSGFAYRTALSLWTFVMAGGLALLISWLTVSYQSVKAAVRNPVRSLKSE